MTVAEIFELIIATTEAPVIDFTPVEVAKPNWTKMTSMATNGKTEVRN